MEGALLYSVRQGYLPGSSGEQPLTITARPAPNAAPARLKVRKSIDSLSAQELADFRRAVKQAIALNDKRGFDNFASCMAFRSAGASITMRFSCLGTGLTCTGWSSRSSRRSPA